MDRLLDHGSARPLTIAHASFKRRSEIYRRAEKGWYARRSRLRLGKECQSEPHDWLDGLLRDERVNRNLMQ